MKHNNHKKLKNQLSTTKKLLKGRDVKLKKRELTLKKKSEVLIDQDLTIYTANTLELGRHLKRETLTLNNICIQSLSQIPECPFKSIVAEISREVYSLTKHLSQFLQRSDLTSLKGLSLVPKTTIGALVDYHQIK